LKSQVSWAIAVKEKNRIKQENHSTGESQETNASTQQVRWWRELRKVSAVKAEVGKPVCKQEQRCYDDNSYSIPTAADKEGQSKYEGCNESGNSDKSS